MWRVIRTHPKYPGEGYKDFEDVYEAEDWLHTDETEQDMEDGFIFSLVEVKE